MTNRIQMPWGKGTLEVVLPDKWRILGQLEPKSVAPASDAAAACADALKAPIGAERLASRDLAGRRVIIAVDDHSRPTPVREFINPVLQELVAAGAREQDVQFIIATGVHRKSQPEEVERKLGAENMAKYRWQCHDAYDLGSLADLGTTSRGTRVLLNRLLLEADLIICVGSLEPHLLLGFGGGLKMIIPGLAGPDTIGKNHMQGVDPDNFDYVGVNGDESPMRLDLEEGARMLGREVFIVNAVMNEHARPCRFFCGDPVVAHRAGERFLGDIVRLEVPEQADAVLTNSFPMDSDLRQSLKCLGNSLFACKSGGVLMGCVRAEHGVGELAFANKTLPYSVTRALLKIMGKERVLPFVQKVKKRGPVEEVFVSHFGLQMLRRCHLGVFSDSALLPPDIGRKMGLARSFVNSADMVAWAAGRLPRRATIWVMPCGGTSYVPRPTA